MKLTRYKHDFEYSYALGATLVFELLKTNPALIKRVFIRPGIKHGEDLEKILSALQAKHIEVIDCSSRACWNTRSTRMPLRCSSRAPFCSRAFIRASMGAVFHLNIQQFATFEDYAKLNADRKYYAFMLDDTAKQLSELHLEDSNYALIFGNEAAGLPSDFTHIAQPIFIPQSSNVDSLNLSVATSIALYTFRNKK